MNVGSALAAEHAHAADRFAREIGGILTLLPARSRRLMGRPLGRALAEEHNRLGEECSVARPTAVPLSYVTDQIPGPPERRNRPDACPVAYTARVPNKPL